MSSCPYYSALSYTWGKSLPLHDIIVEGATVTVPENLYLFFRNAILSGQLNRSTWLWIDQISINQDDVTERDYQVHLMADIYSNAMDVWAWLGVASENEMEIMTLVGVYAAIRSNDSRTCGNAFEEVPQHVLKYWLGGGSNPTRYPVHKAHHHSGINVFDRNCKRRYPKLDEYGILESTLDFPGAVSCRQHCDLIRNYFSRPVRGAKYLQRCVTIAITQRDFLGMDDQTESPKVEQWDRNVV
ncbi:hypothetical protein BT63DRAFT_99475 [Microthyrium microscopicum]|uniref:Heterokaryon incompatibility domain-containing protein n=1 Tax=Microthyrium microscopicum TaxID=703497 RepID=A0A6A6TXI6_9PEZI|nr:hypothetical protein BT63DRAFT_99475 [Microthyrium microscopicum]